MRQEARLGRGPRWVRGRNEFGSKGRILGHQTSAFQRYRFFASRPLSWYGTCFGYGTPCCRILPRSTQGTLA